MKHFNMKIETGHSVQLDSQHSIWDRRKDLLFLRLLWHAPQQEEIFVSRSD